MEDEEHAGEKPTNRVLSDAVRQSLQTNRVLDLPAGVTHGMLNELRVRETVEIDGCRVEELEPAAAAFPGPTKAVEER